MRYTDRRSYQVPGECDGRGEGGHGLRRGCVVIGSVIGW